MLQGFTGRTIQVNSIRQKLSFNLITPKLAIKLFYPPMPLRVPEQPGKDRDGLGVKGRLLPARA